MLKDITLGQFFPGDSPIHQLDPRMKLIMTVIYMAALFICGGLYGYLLMTVFIVFVVALSKLKPIMVLKSIKPLLFIIIFTGILNLFYVQGNDVVFSFWVLRITREGIYQAAFMTIRLMYLVIGTSLLTYTTSPINLADGMEHLLKPLQRINIPVHELAMMMTIALRFIPTLIEETDKIINAQKSRGADFDSGNLIRRAKVMVPILVPLFVSAFRRADELAVAMECRCYSGGNGRTSIKTFKFHNIDYFGIIIMFILIASVVTLKVLNLEISP